MPPRALPTALPTPAADPGAGSRPANARPRPLLSIDSSVFGDVRVGLDASLGQATLSIEQLLQLSPGSIVKLEPKLNDLVELRLNGAPIARGEIVAVGENFGVRIVEIGEIS
jgi:flagellar motor switch protein FliN/FliY